MTSTTDSNNIDEDCFPHEFRLGENNSDTEKQPTAIAQRPSLQLEVGKVYSNGHKNAYIVARLQESQANSFPFVSSDGIRYSQDGQVFGQAHESLIMEWPIAESMYCPPDVRGWQLLRSHGGNWLGHVHEWIQCNAKNGESVTWGSHEHVQLRLMSVFDLENLAASCAAAGINQFAREHYLLRAIERAKEKS